MEKIPKLINLCVYDAIPPPGEEDPTVYWFYPPSESLDFQQNLIGMYQTLAGFVVLFGSEKGFKYTESDTTFSCVSPLGSDLMMGLTFESPPMCPTRNLRATETLRLCAKLLFTPPRRESGNGPFDIQALSEFTNVLPDLIRVLSVDPVLYRYPPSTDLWTACECAVSDAVFAIPSVSGVTILDSDCLVFTNMPPEEVVPLRALYVSKFDRLFCFAPKEESDSLQWITGLCKTQTGNDIDYKPPIHGSAGVRLLAILRHGKLAFIFALTTEDRASTGHLASLGDVVERHQKRIKEAIKQLSVHEYRYPICMDDGAYRLTHPSNFTFTSLDDEFLETTPDTFVRFIGQRSAKNWDFIEMDGDWRAKTKVNNLTMADASANFASFMEDIDI